MAVVLETVSFTSRDEMESLISSLGVDVRVANAPDGLVDYYISWGTSEVLFYLCNAGTADQLAAVPWVRQRATVAACRLLSGHAGEPMNETLSQLWETAAEQLKQIQAQEVPVPGLVLPRDNGQGPVVANVRVDLQRIPSIRRIVPSSTDFPEGYPAPTDWPTRSGYRGLR